MYKSTFFTQELRAAFFLCYFEYMSLYVVLVAVPGMFVAPVLPAIDPWHTNMAYEYCLLCMTGIIRGKYTGYTNIFKSRTLPSHAVQGDQPVPFGLGNGAGFTTNTKKSLETQRTPAHPEYMIFHILSCNETQRTTADIIYI